MEIPKPKGALEPPDMNVGLTERRPGETVLYSGPHLCTTCAEENRVTSLPLKRGGKAPECPSCGTRARWEP